MFGGISKELFPAFGRKREGKTQDNLMAQS